MSTICTSETVRAEIESANHEARVARARRLAFLEQVGKWEVAMTAALADYPGGNKPEAFGTAGMEQSPLIANLTAARECVRLIEASPLWPIITGTLDPLFRKLDEALAREHDAAVAESTAKHALIEAEEAAKAKLLAKLDSDPAVKRAREALEALAPAAVETPAPVIVEAPAVELELASDAVELETADPLKGDFHD